MDGRDVLESDGANISNSRDIRRVRRGSGATKRAREHNAARRARDDQEDSAQGVSRSHGRWRPR